MAAVTTITYDEQVQILGVQVKRDLNELWVKIDRPWEEMSEGLRDKLFKQAKRIARKKRILRSGWTFHFYCK